jgi:poly(A) RNA polymerase GLD2
LFHQRGNTKWGLFLVGSTISGFGSDSSDIDMCLVMKDNHNDRLDPRIEAMTTLHALQIFLQNSMSKTRNSLRLRRVSSLFLSPGPFQNFSLINAKVPILRFRDASNKIEIDLNYNNCIGVRNTHLLNSYAQSKSTCPFPLHFR